ncbi:MAG: hypothetical protein Q9M15_09370 [Mariprofundaceae bacterium]|nr:hypothetical protein [Mariprofundaceae bacterium]
MNQTARMNSVLPTEFMSITLSIIVGLMKVTAWTDQVDMNVCYEWCGLGDE